MSLAVVDTQPKRNPVPLDHGGRSMEEITDDYFSTISPIGRKIVAEKRKCMDLHRRDWDRLTQMEKDSILDERLIDPKAQLRYELKLGRKTSSVTKSYPRLKVESGGKVVHYSEQEDGSQSQSKETVSWKDEFSGPFCWETKCQQELTILTPETISASSVPSPSITHDLIKVSDPGDETDAEWFAKSNKDKNKLSVMLMRDVSNRNSLGNNLLASSSERLAFDHAVNTALAGKPKPKDKATTNGYGNAERRSSQEENLEKRKKTNKQGPTEKMKSIPPTSLRTGNGSKDSLIQELDRKLGSGGKGKEKNSFPQSHRMDSGSKSIEIGSPRRDSGSKSGGIGSPRRDSGSKSGGIGSPRRDSGSKSVALGSPRRESGSKKKREKKQLLPPGLVTELEKELKVQDNVNFDMGKQQKEEQGQGDATTEGSQEMVEAISYEFLFDW